MPRSRVTLILVILGAILLLLLFSGNIALFLTNWMWFEALGYESVFTKVVTMRIGVGAALGLFSAAFIYANILWALAHTVGRDLILPPEIAASPLGAFLARTSLAKLMAVLCGVIGVLFGLGMSVWWEDILLFVNQTTFDYPDPVFGRDASFYVFTLPLLSRAPGLLAGLVVFAAIPSVLIYLMRGAVSMNMVRIEGRLYPKGIQANLPVRRHLAVLVALLLALLAMLFYLRRFSLIYQPGALFAGPGYSAVHGTLRLLTVQAVSTLAAAAIVFVGIVRANRRWLATAAVAVLVPMALTAVVPRVLQRFVVDPSQLTRERDFIQRHINATRFAFGLEAVEERSLSGQSKLTAADIEANQATIRNVRLWDHGPLLDTLSQRQELRTYYHFASVDNDRYVIDGELRQLMLSPRELITTELPPNAQTWVNTTMNYTHGYGLAMGPVNEVTPEGEPRLFVQDIPPVSIYPELEVTQPEIYYGEVLNDAIYVRVRNLETGALPEFDYPFEPEDKRTKYSGTGGVPIGSAWARLLFSMRLGSLNVLVTKEFTSETRVLLYRNIIDRAARVAPFLLFDSDPYMVVADGKLYWILDAYTYTGRFPYSQFIRIRGERPNNYMRNSVKVIVDAYNGTTTFYRIDLIGETDPIIETWSKAFPEMFRPLDELQDELRMHLRYAQDFFRVQTTLYTTYHMKAAEDFYNKEDQWEVPLMGDLRMDPYYTIMKLPGEETEEFILMIPFTPISRNNLGAWMVARSDGDNYGRLRVYQFPRGQLVEGPAQIDAQIDTTREISREMTLLNQAGSEVIRGTLLVIPIEESLIYVQPFYLRAEKASLPELKYVIVACNEKIAMAPTLDEALDRIFETESEEPTVIAERPRAAVRPREAPLDEDLDWEALVEEAGARYEAMNQANRDLDWARYGEELDRLGEVLKRLIESGAPPSGQDSDQP